MRPYDLTRGCVVAVPPAIVGTVNRIGGMARYFVQRIGIVGVVARSNRGESGEELAVVCGINGMGG